MCNDEWYGGIQDCASRPTNNGILITTLIATMEILVHTKTQ